MVFAKKLLTVFPKQCLHYGVLNCLLGSVRTLTGVGGARGIPAWDPSWDPRRKPKENTCFCTGGARGIPAWDLSWDPKRKPKEKQCVCTKSLENRTKTYVFAQTA